MISDISEIIKIIITGGGFGIDFHKMQTIRGDIIQEIISKSRFPLAAFRRGGSNNNLVTYLDLSDETKSLLEDSGALTGMDGGFDMYLLSPWKPITSNEDMHIFEYNIYDNGIDRFRLELSAQSGEIKLLIFMSNGYLIRLMEGESNPPESNQL